MDKKALDEQVEALRPNEYRDLGDGLELWKFSIKKLREQEINARVMEKGAFDQLSYNIKSRGSLESLPLCAVTEYGIEIVSGHHRIRAARKAGVDIVWILVDVTGLSRDQIKAKQLAHNSLQGEDNADLVKKIFESIMDVEARIEAFIEPGKIEVDDINLSASDFDVSLETRIVTLVFLPAQYSVFKAALEELELFLDGGEVFLATREEYDTMVAVMGVATEAYDIRSIPTLFAKMSEIVMEHAAKVLAEKEAESGD